MKLVTSKLPSTSFLTFYRFGTIGKRLEEMNNKINSRIEELLDQFNK
jgi:hypothetical protein